MDETVGRFQTECRTNEIAGLAPDEVSNPRHYMGHTGITCRAALESMMGAEAEMHYWWGCAFKYLWRWREKNGVQDLMKCRQCLDYLVEAAGRTGVR